MHFITSLFSPILPLKKSLLLIALASMVVFVILFFSIHFDLSDDFEGLYILRCDRGRLFDIKNDLMLGEEYRVLARVEFEPFFRLFNSKDHLANEPHLEYRWNKRNGSGYIFNYRGDGTQLLTCFSRFRDSQGKVPKGLFLGGGLPYSKHDDIELTMSATGMAHFNGKEWHHLWCNANETIASAPDDKHDPSTWEFLDSKVLFSDTKKFIVRSSHRLPFSKTTLRIDRYAIFRAGEPYFVMLMSIANAGPFPTQYFYVYGDEPWVGEFGTSAGNIGWTKDKLYYYESPVDLQKNSFAGMYDKGNPMILGEKRTLSEMANFVEWMGDNKPNLVYFSNKEGQFAEENQRIPLYSKDNRVLFLQWGPRTLLPNGQDHIIMAIGMADSLSTSNLPAKPEVSIDPADLNLINADRMQK